MKDQRNKVEAEDSRLTRAMREQARVEGWPTEPPSVKEQKWPTTVMAISIFITLFTVLWLGRRTFVPPLVVLRWMALFCVVGTLLPYAYSGLRLGMEKLEWFFFNVLAIGPLSICALLAVNHYVHGPVRWFRASMGSDVEVIVGEGDQQRSHVLSSHGDLYFSEDEITASVSRDYQVGVARGCLGYWSITAAEMLP